MSRAVRGNCGRCGWGGRTIEQSGSLTVKVLPFVVFASLFYASGARSADLPPPPVCAAAMTDEEKPVSTRGIVVQQNGPNVLWSLCIVSDQPAMADVSVTLSGFDRAGRLFSLNGYSYGFLPKTKRTSDTLPDAPAIIENPSVSWQIPAGTTLSGYFLVAVKWTACVGPATGGSCPRGNERTDTFLRKIEVARIQSGRH